MKNNNYKQAVEIIVKGVVIGVGFRWWVKQIADKIRINGWVRNDFNRTVIIHSEGENEKLEKFIAQLENPIRFKVVSLEINPSEVEECESFEIKV